VNLLTSDTGGLLLRLSLPNVFVVSSSVAAGEVSVG
jgi:hypothetical protein